MRSSESSASGVAMHDLTHEYSDDPSVYRRGSRDLDEIKALAKDLPRDEVVKIWNAEVDRKLKEGFREPFYWKE